MQLGEEYKLNYSIEPSTAYQGVNVSVDDKEGIEITNDVICAKKVGEYKVVLSTIDETNISKVINIKVEGEDTPIFVTNSIFDNQNILSWNEEFNPLNNIRAFDDKDGDITNKIVSNIDLDYFSTISGTLEKVDFAPAYFEHLKTLVDYELIKKINKNIIFDGLYSASIGYFDEILRLNDIKFDSLHM